MKIVWKVLGVVAFSMVLSGAASARNITSEVQYYRNIVVEFSEQASICGLSDEGPLVELAKQRLSDMDVPHNPDGLVDVHIEVTALGGGVLKQRCASFVQIQLRAAMKSTFLDANAYEGSDQTFVMVSERDYSFPMIFYQAGAIYTDLAPSMPEKTLEILSSLFDKLKEARSLR